LDLDFGPGSYTVGGKMDASNLFSSFYEDTCTGALIRKKTLSINYVKAAKCAG
jgi:hypothetical protein